MRPCVCVKAALVSLSRLMFTKAANYAVVVTEDSSHFMGD